MITAEGGAARQDLMVGLERRGWKGEVVWGFARSRTARRLRRSRGSSVDMAAFADVDSIVVAGAAAA